MPFVKARSVNIFRPSAEKANLRNRFALASCAMDAQLEGNKGNYKEKKYEFSEIDAEKY
jgi:hypothetical protein